MQGATRKCGPPRPPNKEEVKDDDANGFVVSVSSRAAQHHPSEVQTLRQRRPARAAETKAHEAKSLSLRLFLPRFVESGDFLPNIDVLGDQLSSDDHLKQLLAKHGGDSSDLKPLLIDKDIDPIQFRNSVLHLHRVFVTSFEPRSSALVKVQAPVTSPSSRKLSTNNPNFGTFSPGGSAYLDLEQHQDLNTSPPTNLTDLSSGSDHNTATNPSSPARFLAWLGNTFLPKQEMNPTQGLHHDKPAQAQRSQDPRHYTTTSSPMAVPGTSSTAHASRKPKANLQLQGLPVGMFHPAVYQSATSSATSSPTHPRVQDPRNPRSPQRMRAEARQQLRSMQRDFITRGIPVPQPTARQDTPKAPSLAPVMSPGPATPLNLHEQANDYLSAGSGGGLSSDKVEEIIRQAREGSSGLGSNPGSPAASPGVR